MTRRFVNIWVRNFFKKFHKIKFPTVQSVNSLIFQVFNFSLCQSMSFVSIFPRMEDQICMLPCSERFKKWEILGVHESRTDENTEEKGKEDNRGTTSHVTDPDGSIA